MHNSFRRARLKLGESEFEVAHIRAGCGDPPCAAPLCYTGCLVTTTCSLPTACSSLDGAMTVFGSGLWAAWEKELIPMVGTLIALLSGDSREIAADARRAILRLYDLWCQKAQHCDLAADDSDKDFEGIEALVQGTPARYAVACSSNMNSGARCGPGWHRDTSGDGFRTSIYSVTCEAEESDHESNCWHALSLSLLPDTVLTLRDSRVALLRRLPLLL